jgi:hypothetical protein
MQSVMKTILATQVSFPMTERDESYAVLQSPAGRLAQIRVSLFPPKELSQTPPELQAMTSHHCVKFVINLAMKR